MQYPAQVRNIRVLNRLLSEHVVRHEGNTIYQFGWYLGTCRFVDIRSILHDEMQGRKGFGDVRADQTVRFTHVDDLAAAQ